MLYFTNIFDISEETLEEYGAFNISLVTDLPLFIDPFLLFTSQRPVYQKLHDHIIRYLRFLHVKSLSGCLTPGLLASWYRFSEVKQTWLGFCLTGNSGRGLGDKFAEALNRNLVSVFRNFDKVNITRGTHLEKLCLIEGGVGKDMISDFTTNLIKDYLLTYTEEFTKKYINPTFRSPLAVSKARFDYQREHWIPKTYELPIYQGDFVVLTPKDILTKDDTWINHNDLIKNFKDIPSAVDNAVLRAEINNYFYSMIPEKKKPTKDEYMRAVNATLRKYPELIDYFIRWKENRGDEAVANCSIQVADSDQLYIKQFGNLIYLLHRFTNFYKVSGTTAEETRQRIEFLKDIIENKGGHRIFYLNGKPVRKETDVHILFRLTWFSTPSDVSREVNDGRGPADFKISRGSFDKSLVEFKLARNTQLKRNLQKQIEVYKKASDAEIGYKVIIYFSEDEFTKVQTILEELELINDPHIYLIDARRDNKPSGSKA